MFTGARSLTTHNRPPCTTHCPNRCCHPRAPSTSHTLDRRPSLTSLYRCPRRRCCRHRRSCPIHVSPPPLRPILSPLWRLARIFDANTIVPNILPAGVPNGLFAERTFRGAHCRSDLTRTATDPNPSEYATTWRLEHMPLRAPTHPTRFCGLGRCGHRCRRPNTRHSCHTRRIGFVQPGYDVDMRLN